MKSLTIAFAICAALAFAQTASASYNTDAHEGAVTCHAGNMTVKINKDRSKITVASAYDPGHPEEYSVTGQNSDGDTYVEYDSGNKVFLTFSDRGDEIEFQGRNKPISLKCPQE